MKRILVGLSGGVDSAMTVYLLKEQGYQVTGVFLDMLGNVDGNEFRRAEILARQLGIELIRKDIRKVFQKEIVNEFVNDYKNGITPNPCVICNPKIKFKYLLEVADELGVEKIATGHYARISEDSIGENVLLKAKDQTKDQSYFLYKLIQRYLRRIKFPLGKLEKVEVERVAKEIGLKVPKIESQDVCFLKGFKNLEEFLQKKLNKGDFVKGDIIDEEGDILGEHQGLLIYTIGQRRGLDIGGDGPFYVVGKDFERNKLLVSRDRQGEKLCRKEMTINEVNWTGEEPVGDVIYQIKIRYRMKSVEAKLEKHSNRQWQVRCETLVWAVVPGQSLVVYDKERVIGGGVIN